jgi:hypothetical protein
MRLCCRFDEYEIETAKRIVADKLAIDRDSVQARLQRVSDGKMRQNK